MKLTLLEIVQAMLNDTDGDIVNSISDTVESDQFALIVKHAYYDIIAIRDWDFLNKIQQYTGFGDTSQPTKLQIPENVSDTWVIKYESTRTTDTRTKWNTLQYLTTEEFLERADGLSDSAVNVDQSTLDSGVTLNVINNHPPSFWTSFDDDIIYLDSYDSDVESSVTTGKTKVLCKVEPTWSPVDTFIPVLNNELFPYFVNECKNRAFVAMKQDPNPLVASWTKRFYRKMRMHGLGNRTNRKDGLPDYGR